jgi:hypothetical protein
VTGICATMNGVKTVKFRDYLVPQILSGEKNSTWRLFDDKNLSMGDEIALMEFGTDNVFATAIIMKVVEKAFGDLLPEDFDGHEKYSSDQQMYETYKRYYGKDVGPDTRVKIIWFVLR